MKKWIALFLVVIITFSLISCGNNNGINTESQSENNTSSEVVNSETETEDQTETEKPPVIDYISRLRKVQDKVEDKIVIIPRIYTNKPRTTGVGYKGMLHQPDPLHDEDMLMGITKIRKLHMRALREMEFTCADEMLYPENYRYLSD